MLLSRDENAGKRSFIVGGRYEVSRTLTNINNSYAINVGFLRTDGTASLRPIVILGNDENKFILFWQ